MHIKTGSYFGRTFLFLLAVALALPVAVFAREPVGSVRSKQKISNPDLAVISRTLTTTNSVLFGIDNRGNIGKDPGGSSTTGGGFWRSRTDQYVFQSGLHVAGLFDSNRDGVLEDTVETEAVYDEEWREGKASS
ncbi:MAG TPA: hypothetical protein VJ417_14220, partial [Candidatus Glassbacteria bacterium]|nr:hypothetical protein [Candidatus Glassbacteria bacterium]